MRLYTGLAATALFALAACGQSGGSADGNKAGGSGGGSASASGGAKLKPGLYETSVEMKVSGLPANMAKAMEANKTNGKTCVTEEEANRPTGDLFAGEKHAGCEAKDSQFGNGRIHGTLTCSGKANGGQGTTTITMDGTYGSDHYDVNTKMTTTAQGSAMTMEGHMVGRRVGDCPADMKDS
jgi:hypothetical protein